MCRSRSTCPGEQPGRLRRAERDRVVVVRRRRRIDALVGLDQAVDQPVWIPVVRPLDEFVERWSSIATRMPRSRILVNVEIPVSKSTTIASSVISTVNEPDSGSTERNGQDRTRVEKGTDQTSAPSRVCGCSTSAAARAATPTLWPSAGSACTGSIHRPRKPPNSCCWRHDKAEPIPCWKTTAAGRIVNCTGPQCVRKPSVHL